MWQKDYTAEIKASPEVIWAIFRNVRGWKRWIAGLEKIEIKGPFETGMVFIMTPRGQEPVSARLVEVKEKEYFIDESRHGEAVIQVTHRIKRISPNWSRIIYSAQVSGPSAKEIGMAVTADFPDVLKALAALAESKNAD